MKSEVAKKMPEGLLTKITLHPGVDAVRRLTKMFRKLENFVDDKILYEPEFFDI